MNSNIWLGKRVLITGHTGFKGAWLVQVLHKFGAIICGYALSPNTNPSLYYEANIADLCESNIGDIRDRVNFENVVRDFQPEVVFHLAAQPLVRVSYKDPYETYSVNVMGLINLFEILRFYSGVQCIINVTSDKCYENYEWDRCYKETDSMGGHDPYSSSKGCAELITSSWRRSFFSKAGVLVASVRAGNVIGGGDWAEDRLIPDFIRAVENGNNFVLRNPKSIRPWQHVLQPLSGYICLAEKLLLKKNEYATGWNFGPDEDSNRQVEWLALKICQLWGVDKFYSIVSDTSYYEAKNLKLDIEKARNELQWSPKWKISESLEKIVRWHKSYKKGENARTLCMNDIIEYFSIDIT